MCHFLNEIKNDPTGSRKRQQISKIKIIMNVHFIGIGGIGVSALAKYHLVKGHKVSGSDLVASEITDLLKKQGTKIFIGKQKKENLPKNTEVVVYSPAIAENNPELKEAKRRGLKIMSYPEVLGFLSKKYYTIAVTGTHGKSTTTAMLGLLLTKAGLDPTVIVGTRLKEFGNSNCRVATSERRASPEKEIGRGNSNYLVIEADEHFASFLNYWPKIIVLTTIEADHLDYWKNIKNLIGGFKKFVGHLTVDGVLVANRDDENIRHMTRNLKHVTYYSLRDKESKKLRKILKVPGEFNVSNALAALKVARLLKIPDKVSFKALSQYRGAWRRFEINHLTRNTQHVTLISDYGHHPTEVLVTLEAAREKFKNKKIICIFQPHQYQRTYYLFDNFVRVLRKAPVDKLIVTDIYDVAGREDKKIKKKVNSKKLVEAARKKSVIYLPGEKLKSYLVKNLENGNVLIIMGAGNIYDFGKKLFD